MFLDTQEFSSNHVASGSVKNRNHPMTSDQWTRPFGCLLLVAIIFFVNLQKSILFLAGPLFPCIPCHLIVKCMQCRWDFVKLT
ncbi:hypothetical protein Y032_1041g3473 [Ancylostoma ceylanicum]|uniref:Uncharacterized protein n=1 Tax=Ancylostoma ceylanicum TaxID=53326 RepID=A0A016W787_9BILA|nr:hypothetical protein Y032_1041g3473 [Ancylostoma ceylanicum]